MPVSAKIGIQIAVVVIMALVLRFFVIAPYMVPIASMSLTLLPGDYVLANKLAYHLPGSNGPAAMMWSFSSGRMIRTRFIPNASWPSSEALAAFLVPQGS